MHIANLDKTIIAKNARAQNCQYDRKKKKRILCNIQKSPQKPGRAIQNQGRGFEALAAG